MYTFNVAVKFTEVFSLRFFWGKTNALANGSAQATFPFNSQPGSRPVTLLIILIQANSLPCTCAYVLCTSLNYFLLIATPNILIIVICSLYVLCVKHCVCLGQ